MKNTLLVLDTYAMTERAPAFMERHGVRYGLAVPQPIGDCWQFYMCEHDLETLPDLLSEVKVDNIFEGVGHGLSEEDAHRIAKWISENEQA